MTQEQNTSNGPPSGTKTCECYKSKYRDPKCLERFPEICPWREWDLFKFMGALPREIGN
jgi:hypothetical protein